MWRLCLRREAFTAVRMAPRKAAKKTISPNHEGGHEDDWYNIHENVIEHYHLFNERRHYLHVITLQERFFQDTRVLLLTNIMQKEYNTLRASCTLYLLTATHRSLPDAIFL